MFCDYDRPDYRVYSYLCNIKLRIRMKRLKLGIALVIVVALGAWVASRWHTWFVEEDEETYVPSMTPAHVLLTFGDAEPLSRNVSWQADTVVRPSWLELACLSDSDTVRVEAAGEVFRSRGGLAAYYVARLRTWLAYGISRRLQPMPIVLSPTGRPRLGICFRRNRAGLIRYLSSMWVMCRTPSVARRTASCVRRCSVIPSVSSSSVAVTSWTVRCTVGGKRASATSTVWRRRCLCWR